MDFEQAVRAKFRYVHSDEVREFLETLVATSVERTKLLPVQFPLWRAQLGCRTRPRNIDDEDMDIVVEEEIPFSSERMKPRRNAAHEGRVNPKEIPCLYVSTDKNTAMAEVRPWLGAKISVGYFRAARELRVIDFSVHHDKALNPDLLFPESPPPPTEVTEGVWVQVDKAFSKPITEDLSTAEYVPTQIIAEMFRRKSFDGLVYKSMLGDGFNLALFDLDSADLVASQLFTAATLAYGFKAEGEVF